MQNSLKTFLQRTSGLLTSAGADVVRWQIYLFPVHLQRQGIKGRGSRKEGGGGGGGGGTSLSSSDFQQEMGTCFHSVF